MGGVDCSLYPHVFQGWHLDGLVDRYVLVGRKDCVLLPELGSGTG